MVFPVESPALGLTVADLREALREKLLGIVGHASGTESEGAGGPGGLFVLRHDGCSALLFDRPIEDLEVHELVAAIRRRYPKLNVVLLNGRAERSELPCRFGSGPRRQRGAQESPIARAAAAHWHSTERSFAVARTIDELRSVDSRFPQRTRD